MSRSNIMSLEWTQRIGFLWVLAYLPHNTDRTGAIGVPRELLLYEFSEVREKCKVVGGC
jgi:hypothetical protein